MRTAVLLLVLVTPLCAVATPAGISGFSGKGGSSICTSCHQGGAAPTVALTGPATLTAGTTGTYTFTITGGAGINAGMDASLSGVNSGGAVFTAGTGTKLLNGEVVHSAAKAFAAGSAIFTFSVKAPLTAGVFTLTAAGLSANNNGSATGDNAAMMALNVTVSVTGGQPPVGSPDAGSIAPPAPVDAGSGTPSPTPTPTPSPTVTPDGGTASAPDALPTSNGNRYNAHPQSSGVVEGESGCNSTGGMPMVVLVALLGGALLIRANRTKLASRKN